MMANGVSERQAHLSLLFPTCCRTPLIGAHKEVIAH